MLLTTSIAQSNANPRVYFWFAFKAITNAYVLGSIKHHISTIRTFELAILFKQCIGIYLATPHLGIHWAFYTAKRILKCTQLLNSAPPPNLPKTVIRIGLFKKIFFFFKTKTIVLNILTYLQKNGLEAYLLK